MEAAPTPVKAWHSPLQLTLLKVSDTHSPAPRAPQMLTAANPCL